MNTQGRIRLVLEAFDAVERRDRARLNALYHADVEFHWPPSLLIAWDGNATMEGWDQVQPTAAERRMDPRVAAADEDVVVQWHWRARGLDGELFETPVLGVYRVRDGKLADARMFFFDDASAVDFLNGVRRARSRTRTDLDIVKRLFRAVRQRDGARLLSCYGSDVVIREEPSLPYGGEHVGHEGARRHAAGFVKCWRGLQREPDLELAPQFFEADGTVVVLWRLRAAHAGERLDVAVVGVYLVRNGRIVETRMSYFDLPALLGFLRRAGRLDTGGDQP